MKQFTERSGRKKWETKTNMEIVVVLTGRRE
jgi:hypothetical protein